MSDKVKLFENMLEQLDALRGSVQAELKSINDESFEEKDSDGTGEVMEPVNEIIQDEVKSEDTIEVKLSELIEDTKNNIEQRTIELKLSDGKEFETKFDNAPIEVESNSSTFSGYVATFRDTPDSHGDIIQKGAFTRTINAKSSVPFLFAHDQSRPIGVAHLTQDEKGLRVDVELADEVQDAREAKALAKLGLNSMSIGYIATRSRRDKKSGYRLLDEVRILECSQVAIPADDQSMIDINSIKNDDTETENKKVETDEKLLEALTNFKSAFMIDK